MNQRSSFRLNKLPLLAVVTYCISGGSAHADDAKIYPGEMCHSPEGGADLARHWGRIKNNTDAVMSLQCPVIRDETNFSISYGTVWVLDQHYYENFVCTMGIVNPTTDDTVPIFGYFSSRSTASLGTAQSSTPLALANFSSLAHINNGYVMITCDIPPVNNEGNSSGIVSYRVSENN